VIIKDILLCIAIYIIIESSCPTRLTESKSSGVVRILLVEILPNSTRLTERKASGFRAFTVQNPAKSHPICFKSDIFPLNF
jgi:hypothetical protein